MADELALIRWDAPGPYAVAFTTRLGGVSEGPFGSLNLAALGGDERAHVDENRRRLCAALGADPARLTMNRQRHSTLVHRARAGALGEPGDGLWTDEPGVPMLKLTADCVPIALARANGGRPALALLHAGWRGLADGIVEAGVTALGGGRLAACVGPAAGPCCYEVGPEVSERFDADLTRGRLLDLWSAAERALRAAGVEQVERVDLCTRCNPDLFFSHRRQGMPRGCQGVVGLVA
ncbi:MAG TPA: polyphenol oxidase family protein [Gaiellaceae bacterium]|nr:polyphenol oxidase family protein [Gaiellaceae bacterium]